MGYIERNLVDGELIIAKAHKHHSISIFVVFFGLAYFLWGVLTSDRPFHFDAEFIYLLTFVIFGIIGLAYLQHASTQLAVTDRRIIGVHFEKMGKITKLDLCKLQDVSINQGTIGKKLGYGTIILTCKDGSSVILPDVADPQVFQKKILEQIPQFKEVKI